MSHMANYWSKKGWSVTLITLASRAGDFYPLEREVARVALDVSGSSSGLLEAIFRNMRRVWALRSAIRRSEPDAVVSFMDSVNIITLLATRFTRIPVVVAERTDPREHRIATMWDRLRNWLYPQADAVVVQTHNGMQWAQSIVKATQVHVIPNSVDSCPCGQAGNKPEFSKPFILAVGRLGKEKGFDLLLQAFQDIYLEHPEWSLVILGEGAGRGDLEALADSLGLGPRVHLPGLHANPASVMRQAEIFVLSSRYEGFPNVLLEAMACQIAVVSFDCHSGPREIIRHNVDGVLVPPADAKALAAALRDLIMDEGKRKSLAGNASQVTERFGVNRVMGMWEKTLMDIKRS